RTRTVSPRLVDSRRRAIVVGESVRLLRDCLSPANPTHHDWMGAFAIIMALVYAGIAKLLLSRAVGSRREILLLIAVALTFLTVAIPIQLRSNWITIAWAVEGVAI